MSMKGAAPALFTASTCSRQKGVHVKNLMTWGGQHQGIVNVPGCTIFDDSDNFNFVCTVSARTASSFGSLAACTVHHPWVPACECLAGADEFFWCCDWPVHS